MIKKMSLWGVGPAIMLLSACYGAIMVILTVTFYPLFQVTMYRYYVMVVIGLIFIIIGIPFIIISVITTKNAYAGDKLVTNGIFRCCRNPIYASWIVFLVPGIGFLSNSWLVLTIPFVMYFILKKLIVKEEEYLSEIFGEVYLKYKSNIPCVLPYGFLYPKQNDFREFKT